jgi:hypothetical protein
MHTDVLVFTSAEVIVRSTFFSEQCKLVEG